MSKYNFAKRLKRMLDNECEITRMETKIARKCAKYYQRMNELKTIISKQEHELSIYRHKVDKIHRENELLEEFIKGEEEKLVASLKNVKILEEKCEQATQHQAAERKATLMQMDFIRRLKETTGTYFNIEALPHSFQGVQLCDTETSTEWQPFAVDAQEWIKFVEQNIELMSQKEETGRKDMNTTIVI